MRQLAEADEIGAALRWVRGALDRAGVPFQVVGGLAARAHGGTRPVVDVDLYAPLGTEAVDAMRDRLVWGPQRLRDDCWDLVFLKADHGRVRIEVGDVDSGPRYFDRSRHVWTDQEIDLRRSVARRVFGVEMPVMPLNDLLAYKTALGRDVDRIDVAQLRQLHRLG